MKVKAFPAEAGLLFDVPESIPTEAEAWLAGLPPFVGEPIRRAYISPTSWTDPELFLREHPRIRIYFYENSLFAKLLMTNPGTFLMLESVIYHPLTDVHGPIDPFLWNSQGGAALRSRHDAVVKQLSELLNGINNNETTRVVDFGSGPSRYLLDLLERRPDLHSNLLVRCIDNDPEAIAAGNKLWSEKELGDMVTFQEVSFASETVVIHPEERARLGILVGVICGLSRGASLRTLQRSARFLEPGAILVVSNVSEKILYNDPFTAWILRAIFGWKLVHKTGDFLITLCRKAGFECNPNDIFTDKFGHHNMAVCTWRK